jgi:hypothetical protein
MKDLTKNKNNLDKTTKKETSVVDPSYLGPPPNRIEVQIPNEWSLQIKTLLCIE